jgi:TP901 family phage tail tape measure protein
MGWKAEDMLKGLPGVMNLAAAFGENLGSVSGIVTDTMASFGIQAGDSAQMVDVLAQASINSNSSLDMMGKALQRAAPVASAFGYSVNDVAFAAGLMASAGIQGEEAGMSMKAIFANLAVPSKNAEQYMNKLSISLKDSTGKVKPLSKMIEELRKGFSGLSEAEKEEYAAGIAGKEGMSGLLAIMNGSDQEFLKLKEAMDHSAGAAERLSEIRLDNLQGDISLFQGSLDSIKLGIFSGISGELRELAQNATVWLSGFGETLEDNLPTIRRKVQEFTGGIKDSFGPVMEVGNWFMKHSDIMIGGIAGIATAFGTLKGISAGMALVENFPLLIKAWPVALGALAIGTIVGIGVAIKEHNEKLRKEDLAQRFGDIKLSVEELDQTAKMILDNGNLKGLTLAASEIERINGLSKNFNNAGDNVEMINWKVSIGLELDESDLESYKSSVEEMIRGSIDIVEQARYTTRISTKALFVNDNETGEELINGFNTTYNSISEELNGLGKKAGEKLSKAIVDGVADPKMMKEVEEIVDEMRSITNEVANAKTDAKLKRIRMQFSGKDLDSETFQNLQAQMKEELEEQNNLRMESVDWDLAMLDTQLNRGDISVQEYKEKQQQINKANEDQELAQQARSVSFSTNTIADSYQDEISGILPKVKVGMDEAMENISHGNINAFDSNYLWKKMGFNEMDDKTLGNISVLWENMESDYRQLQSTVNDYLQRGDEVPADIAKQFSDASFIGAAAKDPSAINQMMAINAADNPEYRAAIEQARANGVEVPEEFATYLDNNGPVIKDAIGRLRDVADTEINDKFHNIPVNGTVTANFNLNSLYTPKLLPDIPTESPTGKTFQNYALRNIKQYAKGGLINEPTLSWFAEEGPEMAIPINNSKRSVSLWQQAGQLIGAYEENNYGKMYDSMVSSGSQVLNENSSSFAPVFSPTVYVNGKKASQEEVIGAVQMTYEQFKDWAMQLKHEQYRVSF